MEDKINLHQGHRQRLTERFIKYPDSLTEIELLEMLLYPVIKRKNTNELAHKLLLAFGSIKNVLNATPQELETVNGVGKAVSSFLFLNGKILEKAFDTDTKKEKFVYSKWKDKLINHFKQYDKEVVEFYLLDKDGFVIRNLFFGETSKTEALINGKELSSKISILKPASAIMVHNHLSGIANPTVQDDITTNNIHYLLKILGVSLLDHIIVTRNDIFSYFYSGKSLEKTKI